MRTHSNHVLLLGVGVAGLILLAAALGLPVWSFLPYVAVLALCPLMMFVMMRRMSNGDSKARGDDVGQKRAHTR